MNGATHHLYQLPLLKAFHEDYCRSDSICVLPYLPEAPRQVNDVKACTMLSEFDSFHPCKKAAAFRRWSQLANT